MKDHVVIARFDEETDKRLLRLRKRMVDVGFPVPEWPPHITIAAYEDLDGTLLCEWTSEYASRQTTRVEAAFHAMSVFPPGADHPDTVVLCLGPAHSKPLVDFYYGFHEKHEDHCTGIGWFNSIRHGHPVLHATIGVVPVKGLQQAMELVLSSGVFGKTELTALEVYTYPMELIRRFGMSTG